ncbi:hypothetical protein SDC9_186972 [bioreactor metagenome]|uniref:Uncharacterized protein n=1 Tax=bioreactor metagenome TaxID=1076179 RepID=A0A645HTG3_9ZZZZ
MLLAEAHKFLSLSPARKVRVNAKGVDDHDLLRSGLKVPLNAAVFRRLNLVENYAAKQRAVLLSHIQRALLKRRPGVGEGGVEVLLPVGMAHRLLTVQQFPIKRVHPVKVPFLRKSNHQCLLLCF